MSKRCPKCRVTKPAEDFHKHRARPDGLQSYCKACSNSAMREYVSRNRDALRLKAKKWRAENQDKCRERRGRYWRKDMGQHELKPCPFCGGEAEFSYAEDDAGEMVRCLDCGGRVMYRGEW